LRHGSVTHKIDDPREIHVSDALVMTGAAAKGAFTAGVLSVMSDPAVKARLGLDIRRIVGSSSGALNGAYYAASIRMGDEAGAGERLARVWLDDATLRNVFSPSLRGLLGARGVFDMDATLAVMRRRLVARPGTRHVELRMVVTNAEGRALGEPPLTTYEQVVEFSDEDFDEEPSLDLVRRVAVASASIPILFVPMKLELDGHAFDAVDGGVVDDTPLAPALTGSEVRRIFVISPFPRVEAPTSLRGPSLVSQLLDMLTQERLARDLRVAQKTNDGLRRLEELLPDATLRGRVIHAIGWPGRRPVEIIEIRPEVPLPGQSLSGVFSRSLRETYVRAGVDAAKRVLG
jgi:predicted acylesterase/phospholipase RssA